MVDFLKNYGVYGLIILALRGIGEAIDATGVWNFLTNFFVLLRTVIKPLTFMWDFGTSYLLINLCLGLLIVFYGFKATLIIKNVFSK